MVAGLLSRLAREEQGQDLIEYALLTAFIGLAGMAAWTAMQGSLGAMYAARDAGTQSIWLTPDPQPTP